MAETLKKLVSNDSFGMLQDKLESWLRDYNVSQAGRPPLGVRPSSSGIAPGGMQVRDCLLCDFFFSKISWVKISKSRSQPASTAGAPFLLVELGSTGGADLEQRSEPKETER